MKNLITACLAVTTLLVVGVTSDANANTNSPLDNDINNSLQLKHSWHTALSINQTPGQSIRLAIPIENRTYTLELDPYSTRSDEYAVFMQNNKGELYEVPAGAVRTLRGSIPELDGSVVAGSLMPDGLYARIRLVDGKEYWMEPLVDKINGAAHNLYVFYRTEDVIPSDGVCATDELMNAGKSFGVQTRRETNRGSFRGNTLCTAQLAFDTDYEYYQDWGSNTESRINQIVNSINVQYESEVNLTHEITTIIVRSNSNDPYSSNNHETLLYQFQDEWTSNQSSIPRDVAHLFTGKELDGSVIGVAWVGVICNFTYQYGLSQSDFDGNFSCATDLTAHELGHNWDAGHCDCPSYTMNPYITCANQFTQGSINTITSFANSLSCLSCGVPDPTGGCCVGENCSTMTASDCSAWGGTYLGDNTNCNGDPCYVPPTGACCVGSNCSTMTASDCSAWGGTYLGDNTNCNGDPCYVPPTGACCVGSNCSTMTASDCSASGGSFLGDDSNCQGNPCNDGVWNVPEDFATIQEAIDAASDGYTIAIAAGTYPINSSINAYGKEITIRGATNGDGSPSVIIDGQNSTRVIYSDGDSSNTVFENLIIENGEAGDGGGMRIKSGSPTIINCTFRFNTCGSGTGGGVYAIGTNDGTGCDSVFTNCRFEDNQAISYGGGIFIRPGNNMTFNDCSFTNNTATGEGGGVYNDSSNSTFFNCTFEGNTAYYGGGMMNYDSQPILTNCMFENNTGTQWGGGMYNYNSSSPTLTNCTFTGNTAGNGGGMYNISSSPTLSDCTFESNFAHTRGGGMHNNADSSPTLTGCTFTDNTAPTDGGGMSNYDGGSSTLENCTLCSNTPNQISGDWTDNGGNSVSDQCVINVPEDFATIQEAIDAASDSYTIAIAAGTYPINSSINANGKEITIRGATNGDGSPSVIIDGQHSTRVIYSEGDSSNTVFENLIIENGEAGDGGGMRIKSGSPTIINCTFRFNTCGSGTGGGVYAIGTNDGTGCDSVFTNCRFEDNQAISYGGGIFIRPGNNMTFNDCSFTNNTATGEGGGVYNDSSNSTFFNCMFENNTGTQWGGGMYNRNSSSPTLTNCTFTGNTAGNGGGMYNNTSSSPTLSDCTFESNFAHTRGGGMHNNVDSSPTLTGCTFTDNTAPTDGGGMSNYDGGSSTLENCTLCSNTPNQISGDWTDNGGNTIADECPVDCDADITGDGFVNINDLLTLIANWNTSSPLGDVNEDGIVDVADLLLLIAAWGACP